MREAYHFHDEISSPKTWERTFRRLGKKNLSHSISPRKFYQSFRRILSFEDTSLDVKLARGLQMLFEKSALRFRDR